MRAPAPNALSCAKYLPIIGMNICGVGVAEGTVTAMTDGSTVQAAARCLALLNFLARRGAPLSISEIARELDLPKATAHRLCRTFVKRHFLQQDPITRRYRPGPTLLEVAAKLLAGMNFVRLARLSLDLLARELQQHVFSAAVLQYREMLVCDEVQAGPVGQTAPLLGFRAHLLQAPGGLLCLARLPHQRTVELLESLLANTSNKATQRRQLLNRVARLRRKRFALHEDAPFEGVTLIVSPVTSISGEVLGVLGLCCPSFQLGKRETDSLGSACARQAEAISGVLR